MLFLVASVGIIFWISRSEQERLVLKERAGIATLENTEKDAQAQAAAQDAQAQADRADVALHDIDTLISTLGSDDDLPNEE